MLTLSPPLNLAQRWLGAHVGYKLAKYGMTLAALGFAVELLGTEAEFELDGFIDR